MKFIHEHFKHNGLFSIMFFVTVITIISVSIIITFTTFRMSERFFIEKFSITNAKVMDQLTESFESFHYSIVIASNNILQSGTIKRILTEEQTNAQKLNSIFEMKQQMKRIKSPLDTYEIEVMVTGVNEFSYSTNWAYWPISYQELKTDTISVNTRIKPTRLNYQLDDRKELKVTDTQFIVVSKALMERISGKVYGSMYFAMKESEFKKLYHHFTSSGNDVFILNNSGLILSSNQTELIGQQADELLSYTKKNNDESNHYSMGEFKGKEKIIFTEYLPSQDLYLVNVIDKKIAIGDLINKKQIVLLSIGIALVALLLVFLVTKRLTNSLSTLVKQIENASKYNFDQYVSVSGTYETRQIGHAFNSMLDELHEYLEKLVLSQKEKRHAELAALQQQINPHFLYNTLASIKFMVLQGGKAEAEETINSLISLLQNTVGNVSEKISIKQEIENLKDYVLINQKRYGDRIKVNYFIAPDCVEYQIPKLILQPFIENAFFHGFNFKTEGFINVMVWKKGNTLICEVMDNGDGMEVSSVSNLPETKQKKQHFTGIGVRNVHERIQLIYGDQYGVAISSKRGEGTSVKVTIPIHVG